MKRQGKGRGWKARKRCAYIQIYTHTLIIKCGERRNVKETNRNEERGDDEGDRGGWPS